jgi:putative flippase GtrA
MSNVREGRHAGLRACVASEKFRYLFAGGWNTAFGYTNGLWLYHVLETYLNVIFISTLANIVNITMAFFVYKLFVFRTQGSWLIEYLRCYVTYGGMAILGILLIWLLVSFAGVPFWISQGLAIIFTIAVSFVMHKQFTFAAALVDHDEKVD